MKPSRIYPPLFLAALLLGLPVPPAAANLIAVNEPLRRTESENFIVIYQQSLEAQVPNLIKAFEDAYILLTPVFQYRPRGKTHILFADNWDEHNGFATIFPRPLIAVYAGDVSPGSSIYEPGNFIRSTVFHEMAHLIPMTAQYGIGNFFSKVFGRILPLGDLVSTPLFFLSTPPNTLAPNWYLEGLSIWSETEFVGPGRGRNSIADMIMRMAAFDDRLLNPAEWDLQLPEHPYGEAAYLYGMRAIQYVHEKYGVERDANAPGELADSVAHSFLYFFDRRARSVTGETFHRIACNAVRAERARQMENVDLLRRMPITEFPVLTPERLQATRPKFGPDGETVFFIANGEAERDTLYRYSLASGNLRKASRARVQEGISRLAASPDRRRLYYTRLNYYGRDRLWNEIRYYDTRTGRTGRLTGKGRYRYPAISPDGLRMAAVRNEAGRRVLLEVPLDDAGRDASERLLAEAPPFRQIIDPVYAPDGGGLVYVLAGREASQIRRIDLGSGEDEVLVEWSCIIMSPAFHPSGRQLVFSADASGVYNLYSVEARPGARPRPITHVVGGAFAPDFSPDGRKLAFSTYDSYGYRLAVADWGDLEPLPEELPRIPERWQTVPGNREKIESVENRPPPETISSQRYSSLPAVRPDFWTPWLTASGDNAVGGLAASFSDPAGYQNIFLVGGYDFDLEAPVGSAVWKYSGFYPIFSLYGDYQASRYEDLLRDKEDTYYYYTEMVGSAGLAVSLPFPGVDRWTGLTVGYQYTDRRTSDKSRKDLEDVDLFDDSFYEGGEGALWAALEFFNGTAFPRSMSVENGRYLYAGAEQSARALGGDLQRTRLMAQWHEFISLPWGENHVLKLEAIGGWGDGDRIAQGFFSLGGYGSFQAGATPGLPRNIALRGYPENYQVGKYLARAGASYRLPIWRLYRGPTSTLPIYLQQLFGEIFYEGGKAWGGETENSPDTKWLNAAGIEINFSQTLLRLIDIAPGIGVAYAFDREERKRSEDDEDDDQKLQVYISLKASISF